MASEAAPEPSAPPAATVSDSAPGSTEPMPPSRVNVVPPVSADKPLADAVGTSSDGPPASNAPATLQATPATEADLAKGTAVNDPSGQAVGTVDSITESAVVLAVGERRVQVPRNTIGKNEKGLVIGVTRAELEAGTKETPEK